ncbi:hypothetical protein HTS61_08430 [Escherichia coli]|nr:hypothetical protein [Escherichia coli]
MAMRRSSAVGVRPFKPRDFIFTALFPRFAGWWALFLFSDTAVDSIPHFLILRFSPGRISQLLPLPSDRSFSGCLLPLTVLFNFLFDCFHMAKKERPDDRQ